MPFPTQLPVQQVSTIIRRLRNETVDTRDLAEACYDVLGYGLDLAFTHQFIDPVVIRSYMNTPQLPLTNDQMAHQLEVLVKGPKEEQPSEPKQESKEEQPGTKEISPDDKPPVRGFKIPPWLIPLIWQILGELLKQGV